MTSWITPLLAQQGRFRPLAETSRSEAAPLELDGTVLGVILLAVVSIVSWAIWRYLARRAQARRSYSPQYLFGQLCQVQGLDRTERRALQRLAQQQGLEHPGRLFLEPERFEGAGAGQLERRIRDKLFAEAETAPAA